MPCCCGQNYDQPFNLKTAKRQLKRYQRRGPTGATRRLLTAIFERCSGPDSLLDIGGGVGVLQHELATRITDRITAVEASAAYLNVVHDEARRRCYGGRHYCVEGDFVGVAQALPIHTIATLDKVICCYPDMNALVRASAGKTARLYGIVVPRDHLGVRIAAAIGNILLRLMRWNFRSFVHRHSAIDAAAAAAGLTLVYDDPGLFWSVRIYERHVSNTNV
ncbi:MAG: class I SAM-dependent methyltransferase [Myxococcota bacterium]